MMKLLALLPVFLLMHSIAFAQGNSYKQPATLGIHFIFNDFLTPEAIRRTSLSEVLREKKFAKLSAMSQGLAVSYGKGLSSHYDFYTTLTGSFLTYPIENHSNSSGEFLLLEADATIRGKLFTDKYWFVPYLQAGVGISKYQGYFGAFMPLGAGLQFSFFGEAYLQINTQYRVAVSESASNHFVHGIGLVGNIGKREAN